MLMSQSARAVMTELGEKYFADPRAHYPVWVFTLSEEQPSTRELFELGLIKRHGAGRSGRYLFTRDGHGWLVDNRKLEDAVDDDFEKLAYPETFTIGGVQYKGSRDVKKRVVRIPCAEPPKLAGGDTFALESPVGNQVFKVIDHEFLLDGSLGVGTNFPNILTLHFENVSADQHRTQRPGPSINVGHVAADHVQIGNNNHQTFNITIQQLAERIAASGDPEAKGLLQSFLNNATVGAILGAGTAEVLLKFFGGG